MNTPQAAPTQSAPAESATGWPPPAVAWLLAGYVAALPNNTLWHLPLVVLLVIGVRRLIAAGSVAALTQAEREYLLLFVCFWVPMVVSLVGAVDPARALAKTASFPAYALAGLGLVHALARPGALRASVAAVGVVLGLWLIDGWVQFLAGRGLLGQPMPGPDGPMTGVFHPALRLGLVLAILAPFWFAAGRSAGPLVRALLALALCGAVLLTGNRNALAMLLLGLCALVLARAATVPLRVQALRLAAVVAGVAVLAGAFALALPERAAKAGALVERRLGVLGDLGSGDLARIDEALSHRLMVWELALRVARTHWPTGVGPRGFRTAAPAETGPEVPPVFWEQTLQTTHPHQICLELLVETGVAGLAGFALFWWRYAGALWRTRRDPLALPAMLPVAVLLFPLNSHKALYDSFVAAMVFVLLAVGIAAAHQGAAAGRTAAGPT